MAKWFVYAPLVKAAHGQSRYRRFVHGPYVTEPKVSLSDGAANYTSYYRTYSSRTITFTLHTISTHILVSMNPTNRKISL